MCISMSVSTLSPQVGAVIVNPDTKTIVGKGYNRKPIGCEDRFQGKDNEAFEPGKHHYGKCNPSLF